MRGIVKGMVAVLVLVGFLGLQVGTAQAAVASRVCTVENAGLNADGNVELLLIPVGQTWPRKALARVGEENMVLAIALTAMSTGKLLNVTMEWTISGSEIQAIGMSGTAP